jgi:L-amino acid N-acyltransferase YncA
MTPGLRSATKADLPRIVEIYNRTIPSHMVTADLEPVSVESRTSWLEARDAQRHPVMVFEEGGNVMGWFALQPFHDRAAYDCTAEISIYVDENFRGEGLGSRAVRAAVEHARNAQIDRLVALVFAHNEPSQRLMNANGFTVWGRLPGVAVLDGIRRDVVIFGLAIDHVSHTSEDA